jgi:hypothetical protein
MKKTKLGLYFWYDAKKKLSANYLSGKKVDLY